MMLSMSIYFALHSTVKEHTIHMKEGYTITQKRIVLRGAITISRAPVSSGSKLLLGGAMIESSATDAAGKKRSSF
jgi:hypothetical protein